MLAFLLAAAVSAQTVSPVEISSSALSHPATGLDEVESSFVALLLGARKMVQDVWPGYDPLAQPLLFVYPDGRALLFGHSSPPRGFDSLPDQPLVALGQAPRLPSFDFETKYSLGGLEAYAQKLGKDDPPIAAALAVHERFHVHQDKAFVSGDRGREPTLTASAVSWAQIEQAALAEALAEPAKAEDQLRTFQAVRAHRYSELPEIAVRERWEERHEGMARYVDRLCVPRDEPAAYAAHRLRLPLDPLDMVKHRAYDVGLALGLLLDARVPGWRGRVAAGEGPYDVLASALAPLPEAERERRAADALARYGGEHVERLRRGFEEARLEQDQAVRRFDESKGRRIEVLLVWGKDESNFFSSDGPMYRVAEGETLFDPVGEYVYQSPRLQLNVKARMLWTRSDDAVFFISPDTPVLADGRAWDGREGRFAVKIREGGAVLVAGDARLSLKAGVLRIEP